MPEPSIVAGDYMERSSAAFERACEVSIEEEQRKISPDTHLIALLCDAVRLSREMSAEWKAGLEVDGRLIQAKQALAEATDLLTRCARYLSTTCKPTLLQDKPSYALWEAVEAWLRKG